VHRVQLYTLNKPHPAKERIDDANGISSGLTPARTEHLFTGRVVVTARQRPEDIERARASLLRPAADSWTMIPNTLIRNEHELTTDAVAILCDWLSHRADWDLDLRQTAKAWGIPYERAHKAVKLLRAKGFVHYVLRSGGRGVFTYEYLVAFEPSRCGVEGCQDCGVSIPQKRGSDTDVSTGQIESSFYESRKTMKQPEDGSPEDGYLPGTGDGLRDDDPQTGSSSSSDPAARDSDTDGEEPSPGLDAPGAREDVERICAHLADRVEQRYGKRPVITKRWRTAARQMLDLDGRTEEQVHAAIDWCQDHEFWAPNVRSTFKLREKYIQLRAQAVRDASRNGGYRPSTTDQRVAAGLAVAARYAEREAAELAAAAPRAIEGGNGSRGPGQADSMF
jgi:hypothetical protein